MGEKAVKSVPTLLVPVLESERLYMQDVATCCISSRIVGVSTMLNDIRGLQVVLYTEWSW
jgi:hypothetical protein